MHYFNRDVIYSSSNYKYLNFKTSITCTGKEDTLADCSYGKVSSCSYRPKIMCGGSIFTLNLWIFSYLCSSNDLMTILVVYCGQFCPSSCVQHTSCLELWNKGLINMKMYLTCLQCNIQVIMT